MVAGKTEMALVPCNVCGTLNSDQAEICLSCEFPVKGRRRPVLFQWVALVLALCFALPLVFMVINWFQRQPQQPQPQPVYNSWLDIQGDGDRMRV